MDTNVVALQGLFVALGGDADAVAEVNTIPDMINAIAAIATGATLPAVTGADDGKILKVVDGAWAAADA